MNSISWINSVLTFCETYEGLLIPAISFVSAVGIILQIRSNVKLNRKNLTFAKISELEGFLYKNNSRTMQKIINRIGLLEENVKPVSQESAFRIYKRHKYFIYLLLNYFESLSLAVFEKNIDYKILFRIYGKRLRRAHSRLHPFISLIATERQDDRYIPYQHFDLLAVELDRYYQRENTLWKRLKSLLKH